MQAGDLRAVLLTFAVAALLVVGATAGVGFATDTADGPASTQPDAPAFESADLLATPVDDDGSVSVPEATTSKTVVVDVSHGNAISRAQMEPLVNALVEAGHEVRFFAGSGSSSFGLSSGDGTSPFTETLQDADALIVANPATTYTADESDAVESFADAGGRVLLLADTPSQATATSSLLGLTGGSAGSASGQPNDVASRFDVTFNAGYLYDMQENANNFQYVYGAASGDSEFAADADRTVFEAAVPVVSGDQADSAIAAEDVSYSSTRENGTYSVAVRSGSVVAIGDTWFLSPDGATVADNEALVSEVASFLVSGTKTAGAPQGDASSTATPTSGMTFQSGSTSA
ncbi:DUF4350 domain-containing protein [Halobellus rufus]|uniref:DUF4350 domain-containing protein n=1 Tax=Halobellus rufus TaxID=1448860 RepID=UPI000678C036|nr:DUF4350 domain-containing protein [Halobellus rufus]